MNHGSTGIEEKSVPDYLTRREGFDLASDRICIGGLDTESAYIKTNQLALSWLVINLWHY